MNDFIRLVGENRSVELLGVKLVGFNVENGSKLLFTIVFILVLFLLTRGLRALASFVLRGRGNERIEFWTRQAIHITTAALLLLGILSIWFDDPTRLATALGLVTAGLAFALQKVVTAVAGYFVILRGKNFNVGDRITMGGVRGDVIGLGFIQTTIMEMGPTATRARRRPGHVGAEPRIYRPDRHGQQRQNLRPAGLQLYARFPLYLGRDESADHLHCGPPARREDTPGSGYTSHRADFQYE